MANGQGELLFIDINWLAVDRKGVTCVRPRSDDGVLHILREPHVFIPCCHHICKSCIYNARGSKATCPVCKDTKQFVFNEDMDEKVTKLKVHCPNFKSGCTWQCSADTMESEIKKHLVKNCLEVQVSCPYKTIGSGCDFKGKRRFLTRHLDDNPGKHLLLSGSAHQEMHDFIWTESRKPTPEENRKTLYDWVVEDFKAKQKKEIQENIGCLMSDIFYSNPCQTGYALRLFAYLNGIEKVKGKYLSVYICLTEGKNDDHLEWPFPGVDGHRNIKLQLLHSEKETVLETYDMSTTEMSSDPKLSNRPCGDNFGYGWNKFFDLSELPEAGVLSKDRLHLRCIITW